MHTLRRVKRLLLMSAASFRVLPLVCVSRASSEPARSTRLARVVTTLDLAALRTYLQGGKTSVKVGEGR